MLQLPIEEYFRYHPPTTGDRILKHEWINTGSFEIAKRLLDLVSGDILITEDLRERINELMDLVCDKTFFNWASRAFDEAIEYAENGSTEGVLMSVQQAWMFLNQGIVVDELVLAKKAAELANI
jgi:hypothetical protein